MPLALGKIGLIADFSAMYSQYATLRPTSQWANDMANAIHKYCKSGIPTVIITNFPGGIAGFTTTGPVQGTGLGGFDKPVPGMGLPAAKSLLKSELIAVWSHGNSVKTPPTVSIQMADAIHNYYSQAIIHTKETSQSPLPGSAVVTGPMFGKGGTLTDTQGTGFDAAKPALVASFVKMWDQIESPHSVDEFAGKMADAIHAFCIQGKVNTIGTITAPASVDPLSGSGGYSVGTGTGKGTVA